MTKKELQYREHPNISQSELKACVIGKKREDKPHLYYEEKDCLVMGSILDVIITDPSAFDEYFYIDTLETKPSAKIMSIMHQVYHEEAPVESLFDSAVLSVAREVGYQPNWKDETIIRNLIKEGVDYYRMLHEAGNRQIVSKEEYEEALQLATILTTHEYTTNNFNKIKGEYIHYQFPVYWKDVIECKGLLDMVIFNDDEKTIQPIDIKTTALPLTQWRSTAKRYGYLIQAAYYTDGLKAMYPNHKVLPFKFLVVSRMDKLSSEYLCSESDLNIGRFGIIEERRYNVYNPDFDILEPFTRRSERFGYKQLIEIFNMNLDVPYEVHINQGKLDMDLYGK